MDFRDKLELVGIISLGVLLGNLLSRDKVTSIPSYLWSYCVNKYNWYELANFSIDKSGNNDVGRNILILSGSQGHY